MATKKKEKKVRFINIVKISAKRIPAHPPCSIPPDDTEIWSFEAEGEVYYDDKSSQTLYFFRWEDDDPEFPNGWLIFTKSADEIIKSKADLKKYMIAEYLTNSEAFESPYGTALRYLTALFFTMVTIP